MNGSSIYATNSRDNFESITCEIIKNLSIKNANSPDVKIIDFKEEKKSIGIDQAREVINFMSQKPFSEKVKLVIIKNADYLTIDAQNSLLKTLEEPPIWATIALLVTNESRLIPTVLSRCRKFFRLTTTVKNADTIKKFSEIRKLTIGNRLSYALEISKLEKIEVISVLKNWVLEERDEMLKSFSRDSSNNIKVLSAVISDLESTTITLKLAIEFLFLNIK